jgi:hypothetical protein
MVEDLIRRARQRYLLNEAFAQFAFAVAVCLAGVILLLIFGTRYLGWWTVALFAAGGIGLGIFRMRRKTPDSYSTAIRLDENAGLRDALSTALHFSGHPASVHTGGSETFRRLQREQAEAAAGGVTLERAVPFIFPRAVYAMAALGVLVSGLIALRYHLGLGLNLSSPIMRSSVQDQAANNPKQEAKKSDPKEWMQEAQALLSRLGVKSEGQKAPEDQAELDKALDQALQANPSPKDQKSGMKSGEDSKKSPDAGDPIENPDENQQNDSSTIQEAGNTNATPSTQESLLSKLKDAVSKLISKSNMKEDNPTPSGDQQQKQQGDAKMSGDEGNAGKDKPEEGESMSAALQGDANSQSQAGQKGKLNSNEEQKGQGSGIGSQDGLKEKREAEQLQAMGKIVEIIGKRGSTVSGEMMVEVQSGKNQQLHTAYTNNDASHGETDGDVTRDEIPLSLQPYVQQYFEQVRKAAAPPPAKKNP